MSLYIRISDTDLCFARYEAVAASDVWELGAGWKDAGGYDGAAIANTTDTNAGSAIWKETIDGINYYTVTFPMPAEDVKIDVYTIAKMFRVDVEENLPFAGE